MIPYFVFIIIFDTGNPSYPRDTGFWWFGCKDKSRNSPLTVSGTVFNYDAFHIEISGP